MLPDNNNSNSHYIVLLCYVMLCYVMLCYVMLFYFIFILLCLVWFVLFWFGLVCLFEKGDFVLLNHLFPDLIMRNK